MSYIKIQRLKEAKILIINNPKANIQPFNANNILTKDIRIKIPSKPTEPSAISVNININNFKNIKIKIITNQCF